MKELGFKWLITRSNWHILIKSYEIRSIWVQYIIIYNETVKKIGPLYTGMKLIYKIAVMCQTAMINFCMKTSVLNHQGIY